MDDYWNYLLQLVPEGFFGVPAEAYTVFNVWHDPQHGTHRLERTSVERTKLHEWAKNSPQVSHTNSSRLVFQSLIISTTAYKDVPFAISRSDLLYITHALGISSALVPLLFTPYTTCFASNHHLSWYYGRPGLRALASAGITGSCSRAIIAFPEHSIDFLETSLSCFLHFATHPFMLVMAIRAITVEETQSFIMHTIGRLQDTERLTGFHNEFLDHTEAKRFLCSSEPESVDLATLSKNAGSFAANLGNLKILHGRLGSLKEIMYTGDNLKWHDRFDAQYLPAYRQQSEEMLEMDAIFMAMNQGLLASINEYQNRARSLQNVIFTLIAKEDTNASIDLARESRAIAVAARNDGTSMKTIAIMTMIFLPATFYAALFSVPTLQWQESPVIQKKFWIYWVFTIPSTLIVLLTWYFIVSRQVEKEIRGQNDHDDRVRAGAALRTRGYDSDNQSNEDAVELSQDVSLKNLTKRMKNVMKPALNAKTSRSAA